MQADVQTLIEKNESLTSNLQTILSENKTLQIENKILHQKVQALLKRMFGSKSETLDPNQLELLLGLLSAETPDDPDDTPPSPPPAGRKKGRKRKPRMPDHLPIKEEVIEPEEVKARPQDYKQIGEEVTEELDVIPQQYFRRRIIRPKYTHKKQRELPPVIAPLPARLIEGGYASAGLLTDITLKKYVDHLPLHRQERILKSRHGIDVSRQTMADWVRVVADWLKPIYNHLRSDLRGSGYMQVDETPIRYAAAPSGGSGQGYFWVYYHPGGKNVLYEWHTSRAATCLEKMLDGFTGTIQCDGYPAYTSFAKSRKEITLAGCWAHARRKFYEARDEAPAVAGWFLHQIQLLYRIESKLRDTKCGATHRGVVRAAESRMILERIGKALEIKLSAHLPRSEMGGAIAYALNHWQQLLRYSLDGRLEIDNNLVENAIRPTAIGKKNWLFIGHPEAGDRSAIIYSLLETCRRHGINPQEYLRDVLTRLPSMKIKEVAQLTPANWLAARQSKTIAA